MLFGHELIRGDGKVADLDRLFAQAEHFLHFGVGDLGQGTQFFDDLLQLEALALLFLEVGAVQTIPGQQHEISLFIKLAVPLEERIILDYLPQFGIGHLKPQALPCLEDEGFINQTVQGCFLEVHGLDHLLGQLAPVLRPGTASPIP